jgi:hypothetical protein
VGVGVDVAGLAAGDGTQPTFIGVDVTGGVALVEGTVEWKVAVRVAAGWVRVRQGIGRATATPADRIAR